MPRQPKSASNLNGRCYGYARVSTVMQASEGESLDVQQRVIAGYAQMNGFEVERVFVERGVSGSKPLADRPQGGELLALLQPGDVVITPRLDRMFRSAANALDVLGRLQKRGVSLHMVDLGGDVTGNGVSKLVFTILSAVAENERELVRERVSAVKRDQRQRGRFLGGTAQFGWRVVGKGREARLEPIPEQQAAIRKMRRLQAKGLSLRQIAAELSKTGVAISHMGVRKALFPDARLAKRLAQKQEQQKARDEAAQKLAQQMDEARAARS